MPPKKLMVYGKWLMVFVIVLSLITSHLSLTFAATPLETAKNDYSFEYSKYRDAQERFSTAKSSYSTFKTATAKEQAFVASKAYVYQITTLYPAYFSLVRVYASTLNWQDNSSKYEQIIKTLGDMDTYFATQKQQVTDTKTLEDLSQLSLQIKEKNSFEIDPQLNYITATYEMQNTRLLFKDFENLSQELGTKKQSFVQSAVLSNWQTEVDDIKNKAQAALIVAQDNFDLLKPNVTTLRDVENVENQSTSVKNQLRRSKILFLEAARFF